jgi:hypothetical protein
MLGAPWVLLPMGLAGLMRDLGELIKSFYDTLKSYFRLQISPA